MGFEERRAGEPWGMRWRCSRTQVNVRFNATTARGRRDGLQSGAVLVESVGELDATNDGGVWACAVRLCDGHTVEERMRLERAEAGRRRAARGEQERAVVGVWHSGRADREWSWPTGSGCNRQEGDCVDGIEMGVWDTVGASVERCGGGGAMRCGAVRCGAVSSL